MGLGVVESIFASELSKLLSKYAPNAFTTIVERSPTAICADIPAD